MRLLLLLCVTTPFWGVIGCSNESAQPTAVVVNSPTDDASRPRTLPIPPYNLPEPAAESSLYAGQELRELSPDVLVHLASAARQKKNWVGNLRLEYWAVANGGGSQYNLACAYALTGDVDAALYWLQRTGIEDGVNAQHAERDSDLASVRKDRRWPRLAKYLHQCSEYWRDSGIREEILILPAGHDSARAIPILIGLHGMGTSASEFARGYYQSLADELNVAFLFVSGTNPTGPIKFVWSDDHDANARRIEEAIQSVADEIDIGGERILFGFSQGATAAVEVAARHPERYAGAIALSAGAYEMPEAYKYQRASDHARQTYVLVCGDGEHPMTLKTTRAYAAVVRELGSKVTHKEYPGMNQHTFPPDFMEQMPVWIRAILQGRNEPESNIESAM